MYETESNLLDGVGRDPLSPDILQSVEEFVCKMYSSSIPTTSVDFLRFKLFLKAKKDPENLPPTSDALHLHIKRVHYQSLVWLQSVVPIQDLPPATDHGWYLDNNSHELVPMLLTKDTIPEQCEDLIFCGCTSCSTARCKCRSKGLRCTGSCGCSDGICHNIYNDSDDNDAE